MPGRVTSEDVAIPYQPTCLFTGGLGTCRNLMPFVASGAVSDAVNGQEYVILRDHASLSFQLFEFFQVLNGGLDDTLYCWRYEVALDGNTV